MRCAVPLTLLIIACNQPEKGDSAGGDTDADTGGPTDTPAGVVPVPPTGPYGSYTFVVPAQANWVNTGLYLRAGETAEISAVGEWTIDNESFGPEGDSDTTPQRGCDLGALVARSGLRFEDEITCIGTGATFTAPSDDIVYVGMIYSTDLGETYGDRLRLGGEITVTVTSDGDTVPTVAADDIAIYPFTEVTSGWVELEGAHNIVTIEVNEVIADLDVAAESLGTLDAIYEVEADLRGMTPYSGQHVRWYPDESITSFAYMLAGNPTRCDPSLMNGADTQRILRAVEGPTDIWGFSHELGHSFSFANGTWVYQYLNVESWPNIFTLRALETLNRTEDQPNYDTYCDGRDAYLAGGAYETLRDDPFVQLCFLMEFDEAYGPGFYENFFYGMNSQSNGDIPYDGTDASIWRYLRDRFSLAAGEDTTPIFDAWRVPLE